MGDCLYLHLLALGLVQLLLCGSLGMQKSASSLLPQVTSVALHAGGHGTGEQKLTPAWQHKPTRPEVARAVFFVMYETKRNGTCVKNHMLLNHALINLLGTTSDDNSEILILDETRVQGWAKARQEWEHDRRVHASKRQAHTFQQCSGAE